MTDPVKYVVTLTANALLVELRVPLPVPDLVSFAITHKARLASAFTAAATLVQVERDAILAETRDA
jgi:hypothetical protein